MKKLEITDVKKYDNGVNDVYINGDWAFAYFDEEMEGEEYKGYKVSGHSAMIYLTRLDGTWFNNDGKEIEGHLYFKPNTESGELKITGVKQMDDGVNEVYINGDWAFDYHNKEALGRNYKGCKVSGHASMIILWNWYGTWHTEAGEEIKGYLYFKPKGE